MPSSLFSQCSPPSHNSARFDALRILALLLFMVALGVFPGTAMGQNNDGPLSTHIYELPKSGPPTTFVLIQGAGFDPLTAIDVYFDSNKLASTITDRNGSFGNGIITATGATFVRLQVPANALPGQHTITAQQRVGQKSAQIAFLVQTDWPKFGFDLQRTGLNPYENILNPSSVTLLAPQWKYATGRNVGSSPAVVNGVAYVGSDDGNVYALDAVTGALVWKYATGNAVESSPAVATGTVYIGSDDHNVYALDAKTGALVWKYATVSAVESSPAVANGVVYVGSRDNSVYALDATTGALVWAYATQGAVDSSPAVANGVLYVGSYDRYLYALDAKTGALVWKHQMENSLYYSPAVANGVLYVSAYDSNLYALDAKTGALVWTFASGVQDQFSSPAVANGVLYVGSNNGTLYALDAGTGGLLWGYTTAAVVVSTPAVADGVFYVGSYNGTLYALDASTGGFLWKYETGYVIRSSPAVANGVVYIGSDDSNLHAFGLPSQETSQKLSPPQRPDPARLTPDWSLQPAQHGGRAY